MAGVAKYKLKFAGAGGLGSRGSAVYRATSPPAADRVAAAAYILERIKAACPVRTGRLRASLRAQVNADTQLTISSPLPYFLPVEARRRFVNKTVQKYLKQYEDILYRSIANLEARTQRYEGNRIIRMSEPRRVGFQLVGHDEGIIRARPIPEVYDYLKRQEAHHAARRALTEERNRLHRMQVALREEAEARRAAGRQQRGTGQSARAGRRGPGGFQQNQQRNQQQGRRRRF